MAQGVHVRELVETDLPVVARMRWEWRLVRHPEPTTTFEAFERDLGQWWRRGHDHAALVAEIDGAVVAMGFLAIVGRVPWPGEVVRRHGDVQSVYVLPEHRGRGVGAALVEGLVARALALECVRVTVHSSRDGVATYERAGFVHEPTLLERPLAP